jgi:PEP-CTERM/exosortase A-associated glycosyltransferase
LIPQFLKTDAFRRMRILHVLDHSIPLHSGYTFRTLAILRQQRALGWETLHLTSPKHVGSRAPEEEIDGWHFYRTTMDGSLFAATPVAKELVGMGRTLRRIQEVVRRHRPDVIHAHSPVLNGIPALRAGRQFRIPVVYEVRALWEDAAVDHGTARHGGLRYRLSRALETYALRRADAVTTICEGLRQEIIARGIAPSRITVIPNAVDLEAFKFGKQPDEELRTKLGLEGKLLVGFVGSFYAYEGIDLLLGALRRILAERPEVRVLLVGGGPQEQQLKDLARTLDLADKVIFAGRIPHAEVHRYYSLIDVLAYPRRSMRLTEMVTPLKPLEAMAQGQLLVASDVGGHRELIRDGDTGSLFPAGRSDALADAILRLLRGSDWSSRRLRARRFVESERNWRGSVERYRGVYADLGVVGS